jgi:hypothetical protein
MFFVMHCRHHVFQCTGSAVIHPPGGWLQAGTLGNMCHFTTLFATICNWCNHQRQSGALSGVARAAREGGIKWQ